MESRLEDSLGGRRVGAELCGRTDGTALEVAATVRALSTQARLDASRAPRALEGADHGVRGLGRQVGVAAFAAGAHLQHGKGRRVVGAHGRPRPVRLSTPLATIQPFSMK